MMAYNNFNLSSLKSFYKKSLIKGEMDDAFLLKQLLEDEVEIFPIEEKTSARLKEDLYATELYKEYLADIEEYSRYTSMYQFNRSALRNIDISHNDALSLVNDFFKFLDPIWYDIFIDIYRDKNKNLKFSLDRGYSIYIEPFNYNFINIEDVNNIELLFGLVHEYTHAIIDRIKFHKNYYQGYPFLEAYPQFSELLLMDFIDKDTFLSEEAKKHLVNLITFYEDFSLSITEESNYFNKHRNFKNIKKAKKDLVRYSELNSSLPILSISQLERLTYTISFLTAIELYYSYNEDKEKAMRKISQLINDDTGDKKIVLDEKNIKLNYHSIELIKRATKNPR